MGGWGVNLRSSSDSWYSEVDAAVVFVKFESCLGALLTAVLGLSKTRINAGNDTRVNKTHTLALV